VLSMDHGGTPEERQAIADALSGMRSLNAETADWRNQQSAISEDDIRPGTDYTGFLTPIKVCPSSPRNLVATRTAKTVATLCTFPRWLKCLHNARMVFR
jgi:hypothetical protein